MVPEQEMVLPQVQVVKQPTVYLGPYDPWDPVVLEMLVTNRNGIWNIWQAPRGDLQTMSLRFYSKTMTFFANNSPFRKGSWPAIGP